MHTVAGEGCTMLTRAMQPAAPALRSAFLHTLSIVHGDIKPGVSVLIKLKLMLWQWRREWCRALGRLLY